MNAGPVRRPPRVLVAMLFASLAMSALTAGHARDYVASWNRMRRGKDITEQRKTLGRRPGWPGAMVPWLDASFLAFAEELKRILPPDARILIEPEPGRIDDPTGRARWFLYLNYAGYPLRFYVRKPAYGGGTLVDYGKWLAHHLKQKDVVKRLDEEIEIAARGIDYKVVVPVTSDFSRAGTFLFRRSGSDWIPVPLDASRSDLDAEAPLR